jgi:PIN domain nuclease of toxin-antitoxin system
VSLLLDTHTFLWSILNDPRLSGTAANLILDPNNQLFLSAASYWELAIKISIGKYQLPGPFAADLEQQIAENDITVLPILIAHAEVVTTLPYHHRDPFDRMLIAQAIVERMPILSADPAFDAYAVTRLW